MSSMVIYKSTKEVHHEPFLGRGVSDYLVYTNPLQGVIQELYKILYKILKKRLHKHRT